MDHPALYFGIYLPALVTIAVAYSMVLARSSRNQALVTVEHTKAGAERSKARRAEAELEHARFLAEMDERYPQSSAFRRERDELRAVLDEMNERVIPAGSSQLVRLGRDRLTA